MDILKTATDWAKAEVFSTPFFILFEIAFIATSISFWQLGKTDINAYHQELLLVEQELKN